jgi:hypothetical protein
MRDVITHDLQARRTGSVSDPNGAKSSTGSHWPGFCLSLDTRPAISGPLESEYAMPGVALGPIYLVICYIK